MQTTTRCIEILGAGIRTYLQRETLNIQQVPLAVVDMPQSIVRLATGEFATITARDADQVILTVWRDGAWVEEIHAAAEVVTHILIDDHRAMLIAALEALEIAERALTCARNETRDDDYLDDPYPPFWSDTDPNNGQGAQALTAVRQVVLPLRV